MNSKIYFDDFDDEDIDSLEDLDRHVYHGSNFNIRANPKNSLEVLIVSKFKTDADLKKRLEFSEGANKYHTGGSEIVGVHIEQGIGYARKMVSLYKGWKRDEEMIVSAFMLHDLCKQDETYFDYNRNKLSGKHHAVLACELTEFLLNIHDTVLLKLILHHDDHYRLYRDRYFYPGKKRIDYFRHTFDCFNKEELEALIRLSMMDNYRPKPKKVKEYKKYFGLQCLFEEEMDWFIETAIKSRLLSARFNPFSKEAVK